MKKILNFSLCILLALSLTLGNVAPVANANSYWNNNESEASDENDQETRYYDHIDVRVNAQVKLTTKLIQSGEEKVIKTETKDATVTELLVEADGVNVPVSLVNEKGQIKGEKKFHKNENSSTDNREYEYQSERIEKAYTNGTTITIKCKLNINNGESIDFVGTYNDSVNDCPDGRGIDINITSENITEITTHTVAFVYKDADGKKVTFEQQVIHGEGTEAPEIPEELNDGRKFISWDSDDYIANVTKNLTINANYEYKVTFVDGNNVIEEQYVKPGESATAPANPTREGYEFESWDKDFSNVKEDLIVTAQYKTLTTEEPTEEPTASPTASPTAEPTASPTATPTSTPRFFLLKPNCTQPPERSSYPDANYVLVGSGELNINNGEIFGDDVKNYIISGPNEDSIKNTLSTGNTDAEAKLYEHLNNGWTVYWYVMKKEWDGWHVDGILVSPTPAVTPTAVATATPTAVATTTPTDEVEPEPKETESAAPTETPVVTVTPSAVPTVTPNAVTGTATPVPSVTPGAVATATPGAVTGAATTATPGAVTGAATTATPGVVTGTATPDPTTTPGNNNPIIPNGNPVNPQNPPNSENKTPTATPSNGTDKEDGKEEDSDTSDGKEDSDTNDVNAGTTATPSTDVEIKEDQIPGDASQATAVPSVEPSVTPTTEPTVTPTEKVEATANPDQKEDITVQDTTLPNTAPDSDEETDGNDNATEKDDAVEIEEDDIANSGAEVDEEDADQDAEAEDESEEDDDESTDAEEVEEDEIANALPQTGVMSENVFYYIGSMICAFGICVLAFIRRKTMK